MTRDRLPGHRLDGVPDVRDGLTRTERIVLVVLQRLSAERAATGSRGASVPTAMLYGAVLEHVDIGEEELTAILVRLGAAGTGKVAP